MSLTYFKNKAVNDAFLDYLDVRREKGASVDKKVIRALVIRLNTIKDPIKEQCLLDAVIANRVDLRIGSYEKRSNEYRPTPKLEPWDPETDETRYMRGALDAPFMKAVQLIHLRHGLRGRPEKIIFRLNRVLDGYDTDDGRLFYLKDLIQKEKTAYQKRTSPWQLADAS